MRPPALALRFALPLPLAFACATAPFAPAARAQPDSSWVRPRATPADSLPRADSLPPVRSPRPPDLLLPAAAAAPDTSRVRFEIGTSFDATNEQFYEEAYIDTTFLGRRLVSTPQSRWAAVMLTALEGTRARRTLRYEFRNDLSLGNEEQHAALEGALWSDFAPDWRLFVAPRAEYRHDLTFGRDLTEWRAGLASRLRRALGLGTTFAEVGLAGDLLEASGTGADFLPDHYAGTGTLGLEGGGWSASDWQLRYRFTVREFPDSATRDHLEHGWDGEWRWIFGGGHILTLQGEGYRRATLQVAPTTRDDYWEEQGALGLELWPAGRLGLRARLESEGLQYDRQDTTVFLDSGLLRWKVGPRWQPSPSWTLTPGPRGEWLSSPRDPGEGYQEVGGDVDVEYVGRRAWWYVTPAAGWREYHAVPADFTGLSVPGLHSSFAFYELSVLGDQPLPGALRLRVTGTARLERHTDPAQDARSLYFSVDLRRLF